MTKIIPILLLSIAFSACVGSPVSTQVPEPLGTPISQLDTGCSIPTQWNIQFNRSGGFAGFNESLTLDSGGNLRVQSERPAVNVQETISGDQVNAISGLLAQACPFEMKPNDAGCADCFLYKLDVQMDGQAFVMLATDVTLTEELHPLIGVLSEFLQDTEG
jgi:hypothetical protein